MAKKTNFGSNLNRFFPDSVAVDTSGEEVRIDEAENSQVTDIEVVKRAPYVSTAVPTAETSEKTKDYRINLRIPMELKEYLDQASWAEHMTITRYLNELILRDRDATKKSEQP